MLLLQNNKPKKQREKNMPENVKQLKGSERLIKTSSTKWQHKICCSHCSRFCSNITLMWETTKRYSV